MRAFQPKAWLSFVPLAALCGCAGSPTPVALYTDVPRDVISWERPLNPNRPNAGQRCGPPPPGYIKIVADPVPGWKPDDMHADGPGGPITWYSLGPRPITGEYWSGNANAGGRVVSLAPHPTNPQVVYAASASGGIWKTTNAGQLWLPLTDELSILNHGAVALDPANPEVVYIGTGEYTGWGCDVGADRHDYAGGEQHQQGGGEPGESAGDSCERERRVRADDQRRAELVDAPDELVLGPGGQPE
jgi:hypothetical protein